MKAFAQLVLASLKDLFRDRMSLFWFLVFPVIFIFFFGMLFSNESTTTYNIGVICQSDAPLSQGILAGIKEVPIFNVTTSSKEEELKALNEGQRILVIEIPPLSTAIIGDENNDAEVYVYYDKSKQSNEQILIPIVRQIMDEIERRVTGRLKLFTIVTEPIQGEEQRMIDFILPGILSMALMQLGLFGSLRVVSLREQKILKNLGATPLSRNVLIAAEVLVRMLMALIQTAAIILIGHVVFDVTMAANWLVVLGAVLLGSATFVGIGYMLVSFIKTEESGVGLIQLVQFPMMFLSGVFFPLELIPSFMRPIVNIIPLTYLADLLRQIMVNALPSYSISTDILVLMSWAVITPILAAKFWKWE